MQTEKELLKTGLFTAQDAERKKKVPMQTERELLKTGLFKSRNAVISYLLMTMIDEKEAPVGAWQLQENLRKCGIECSTASVGRLLRNLDYTSYTVRKSNQGRILTPLGQAKLVALKEKLASVERQNNIQESLKVRKYDELIDLLLARKALEAEAARLAALHGTEEDMQRLSEAVQAHRQCVSNRQDPTESAFHFHKIVSEMSYNRFLKTLLDMLIYEEKKIEAVFETLVTRERGSVYVVEHSDIADAIIARDAKRAGKLMGAHIQELYDTIAKVSYEDNLFE